MQTIDWRELYASNRAVIDGAGVTTTPPRAVAVPPTTGLLTERSFSPARARPRHAPVYVPASLEPGVPAPLVCMLHGCTQDARSFAAATRMHAAAERHGFVVVHPEQPRDANPQGCWNWFETAHQRRGAGEPASVAGVVRELIGTTTPWEIDPRRVFVAGLSAGGAMAAILAAAYPDLFAAVAVHSGLAYGSAGAMGEAFAAMSRGAASPDANGRALHAAMGDDARTVPLMVVHGTADRTVAPVNGEQLLEQWMAAGALADPGAPPARLADPTESEHGTSAGGLAHRTDRWHTADGAVVYERLLVDGLGHAWSGGEPGGSFTDPRGPDATEAILRFFAASTPVAA